MNTSEMVSGGDGDSTDTMSDAGEARRDIMAMDGLGNSDASRGYGNVPSIGNTNGVDRPSVYPSRHKIAGLTQ